MGASANVNAFFGVASMIIAVPTGVKVFNWLFTMYGGRVRFTVPVLWTIGFMVTFVLGGLTGVLLAVPPVDWQLHNSLFLVAHFHHVIIPGVVFGAFAGYDYWFPKAFGFTLDERWGTTRVLVLVHRLPSRFHAALCGRPDGHDPAHAALRRCLTGSRGCWCAAAGAVVILAGIVCQIVQLVVSIRDREQLRDVTGDPWNGRTLEWSTASPPPAWNFAVLPRVAERDAYWNRKQRARATARSASAGARVRADRNAEKQRDRLRQRVLCRRHRLCADLAHLVDGRCGSGRRVRDAPRLRVSRRGGGRDTG